MKEKNNKEQQDYLLTSCWYKEIIIDPYQVIAAAFDFSDLAPYRKVIKGVLLSIHQNKIYYKDAPANLLYEFKMLESVVNAAYIINKEKRKSPIEVWTSDLFNKNLYCGWRSNSNGWADFPRSLSMQEYINPYLVFKKFFKYQKLDKWKEDLQEMLDYGLSKNSDCVELDLLQLYLHLTKLIEAAHLIDVREITHVGGHIKNRLK